MSIFFDRKGNVKLITTLATIVISAGALIGGCEILNNYEYSSGYRAGVINKLSKKGFFWKTYEGQMALEGIVSSGGSMGANVWEFSIDGEARHKEDINELTKKLNEALESGKKVRVKYIEVIGGWPWRGSTGYYVQDVEPIEKTEKQ